MARQHVAPKLSDLGDQRDPEGLGAVAARYLTWMTASGRAASTAVKMTWVLGRFVGWCHEHGVDRALAVSRPMVERYRRDLEAYRRADGRPLSPATYRSLLGAVKGLFGWLVRQHLVPYNPVVLEVMRDDRRLPRAVLSYHEVEKLLAAVDVSRPCGLRDRTMMEVLYSTGLRRGEVAHLRFGDLDPERGVLTVREGKGGKDRVVPVGSRALGWVARYLREARPRLVAPPDQGFLFLTYKGTPFTLGSLTVQLRDHMRRVLPGRRGACHVFRHTAATLLLENGANVRYVQELLGHEKLDTTQLYAHVSIGKLKAVHEATHPAEVGVRKPPSAADPRG